jgi:F0F1-type ATP synthase epsilon subunit
MEWGMGLLVKNEGHMELSKEDLKIITDAIIKASNFSETEWLEMEKTMLESCPLATNENASSIVFEMWNQLNRKVEGAMDRMKKSD